MENYFNLLNNINVSDKTEQKNGLTYLSWAFAWAEAKKLFPDATYKIYEQENGCIYWTDGKTAWVKTGVTINGIEHIEYLPIMNFKNQSILVENITSFDVNKTIQRSLTKAVARHGLGLYIYAGEDLPENEQPEPTPNEKPQGKSPEKPTPKEKPKTTDDLMTDEQQKLLIGLGTDINKLAGYLKTPVFAITSKQAQEAINLKLKAREKENAE